ncbi:endoplasmic reticulum oxidoreductin [Nitzschia inconspicua]|uniref:Endoplasmic reticulum oxidoreductin n=1 Tax=Nitzschia inconspicua TaxID=303405 RepID=A0A9K3PGL5_9STRA|nr:endoplasmic reticulum oxidoreductin [Nitzschia inconspicua]
MPLLMFLSHNADFSGMTVQAQGQTWSPSPTHLLTPESVLMEFNLPTGEEIADTLCTMDDLERANDMQLHVIFNELTSTNFFQHFVVDLEHKCPLSLWNGGKKNSKEADGGMEAATADAAPEEEEDEYHCDGGADELDDDAEPLCGVDAGTDSQMMFLGGMNGDESSISPMGSNVLQSLSKTGFSSKQERDTFAWNQQTDIIVQEDQTPCDTEKEESGAFKVPDSFWMDMCSKINEGDGTKLVNLALNPERNTYYNGTHIWKAIYEENCITTEESCLEERVLYRLLSGMHTSTTLSIAENYYPPSKRHNRTDYESNPQYFMKKFQHHPDHIRNLHFSYVVMLRAIKKASEYLYNYEISSGNVLEDEASSILLKRLLGTSIMRSCSNVFSAFDESVMFQEDDNLVLQQSFKGVFHNISSILDCVQCQQCKLHGKLTMLGYGTALKILFVKSPENLVLEPNEVVALINTAARLSESLVQVRELTTLYWQQERNRVAELEAATEASTSAVDSSMSSHSFDSLDLLDMTIGLIASLRRDGLISLDREKELIEMALRGYVAHHAPRCGCCW